MLDGEGESRLLLKGKLVANAIGPWNLIKCSAFYSFNPVLLLTTLLEDDNFFPKQIYEFAIAFDLISSHLRRPSSSNHILSEYKSVAES